MVTGIPKQSTPHTFHEKTQFKKCNNPRDLRNYATHKIKIPSRGSSTRTDTFILHIISQKSNHPRGAIKKARPNRPRSPLSREIALRLRAEQLPREVRRRRHRDITALTFTHTHTHLYTLAHISFFSRWKRVSEKAARDRLPGARWQRLSRKRARV